MRRAASAERILGVRDMLTGVTLPRRARPIVVDGQRYRWIASGADAPQWLKIVVQAQAGVGSRLLANVDSGYALSAHRGWFQRTHVGSALVGDAIRLGLARGWQPDRPGADFALDVDGPAPPALCAPHPLLVRAMPSGVLAFGDVARDEFPVVDAFDITLQPMRCGRAQLGRIEAPHGVLATFAWWSTVADDLARDGEAVVPDGTRDAPWHELDQGHELAVWSDGGFVFVAEGIGDAEVDGVRRFDRCFRVLNDDYVLAWRALIAWLRR